MTVAAHAVPRAVPARSRSLQLALAFVCLCGVVASVPLIPFLERVLLSAVMAAAYLGYLALRGRQGRLDWFEIVIPYGGFFVVSYGVGSIYYAYVPGELFRRSLDAYLTPALVIATAGFLAFVVGYAIRGGGVVRPSRLAQWRPKGLGVALVCVAVGFAGSMATAGINRNLPIVSAFGGIASAVGQFGPFLILGWFLAWSAFWDSGKWAVRHRFAFAITCVIALVVLAVHVGTKEVAITLGAVPIVAFWYARGRLPVKTIGVLALMVIFVVFPVYNSFRYTARGLDTGTRLRFTVESATKWDTNTYWERTFHAFVGRLSYVTSAAAVVRDTGRYVDYKLGETLLLAPISVLIPRFVWPEKPSVVIGREFGETFRLVHERDEETKIGASSIGELYWNFGVGGVIVGMFGFGFVYRWLYRRYGEGHGAPDPLRRGIYVVLLSMCWNIEGGIAAAVAGTIKFLILVSLAFFLFRRIGWIVPAAPRDSAW